MSIDLSTCSTERFDFIFETIYFFLSPFHANMYMENTENVENAHTHSRYYIFVVVG